jgi:5-hydroxyisourate hydrolase
MSPITTHVLDTASGSPAAEVPVLLERKSHSAGWQLISEKVTDANGRIDDLMQSGDVFEAGHYRLSFDTGAYYLIQSMECFFPHITISFVVRDVEQHYHVPLLVSPFGYTTYRGS